MELYFIIFWILALAALIFGLVNLTLGITYKKWKRIVIAVVSFALARYFYYLPYDIFIDGLSNVLGSRN
ncbi:hypothetical protein [Flavobacterium wongokense]|uniref:hypothetical protein n=1 Tax=Flavobacterium wongokense TaxID=2910674 RepID=UPI001F25C3A0|nr:hypothetical protein [Flavobacterium sp. WG47]MCF6132315.1 hypothetical protein [Flavobacterium sp. WG47]